MSAGETDLPAGPMSKFSQPVYPVSGVPSCPSDFEASMGMLDAYRRGAMKEEPLDDTRNNDSGVTSGSECPSTSPTDSERSDSHSRTSPHQKNVYSFPQVSHRFNNPWSPSANPQPSPSLNQPSTKNSDCINTSPSVTPKIEAATNGVVDENSIEFDEEFTTPKFNSHGKMKIIKCKQCDFYAHTKMDFWAHSGVHIKSDKILKCPKCPFVTEYKHHLEYHLLNHAGSKPFRCDHCDYACVNKSMLNSHLKSHSKVYQYRCANCQYETKYCHSLKLHLRKYKHKPAMVLNPDGSPNPLPIIDVYGTRRGPKVKRQSHAENSLMPLPNGVSPPQVEPSACSPQPAPMPFNPLMLNPLSQNAMLPFPLPLLPMPNQEMMMNLQNLFRERLEELARQNQAPQEPDPPQPSQENGALDLTNKSSHSSTNGESDDDENMTVAFENVEAVVENRSGSENGLTPETTTAREAADYHQREANNNRYDFACQYCGICFGDEVMFRIHMGYHGYNNPFTCNMCGEECENKVNFFLHIARAAH